MDVGKLRHRVTIQKQVKTQDALTGEMVVSWADLKQAWASLEPLSVREFIASQTTQSKVTARVTMRYDAEVNASMRIIYRGKIYNIEGVLADKKSGLEYITLPVSEGVNIGL